MLEVKLCIMYYVNVFQKKVMKSAIGARTASPTVLPPRLTV